MVFSDGTVKWELKKIASVADVTNLDNNKLALNTNVNINESQQNDIEYAPLQNKDYAYTGTSLLVRKGLAGGNYTMNNLLQLLAKCSHTHSTGFYHYNCNCYSGDGSCVIKGSVLTNKGYIPIQNLKNGDFILDVENKEHRVIGLKRAKLGKRKALRINNTIYTNDHLFKIGNSYFAKDIIGCKKELCTKFKVDNLYVHYVNIPKNKIHKLEQGIEFDMDSNTSTYIPILEDYEWCIVDGLEIACLRK